MTFEQRLEIGAEDIWIVGRRKAEKEEQVQSLEEEVVLHIHSQYIREAHEVGTEQARRRLTGDEVKEK